METAVAQDAVREITLNGMGKPLPNAVVRQLQYLWQTAATLAASSPESIPVSHSLSLQFVTLAGKNDVVLPAAVKERLCSKCSVILLPTFTCTVRVRARSHRSSANRRPKTSVGKVKNQIVVHCNLCQNSMARPGAARTSRQAPPSAPIPVVSIAPAVVTAVSASASVTKKAVKPAPASVAHKAPPQKPSFSFKALQSGGGGSSSSSGGSSGGLGNLFGDFVPLGSPGPAAGDKRVNLLEMERQRKKQKKKEGAGAGAMGLGSIQKLFSQGQGQGQGQGKGKGQMR